MKKRKSHQPYSSAAIFSYAALALIVLFGAISWGMHAARSGDSDGSYVSAPLTADERLNSLASVEASLEGTLQEIDAASSTNAYYSEEGSEGQP